MMPVLSALSEAEGSEPKGQDLAIPNERKPEGPIPTRITPDPTIPLVP